MSVRVFAEAEASSELEDAVGWYENQRPGLGLEFLEAVDAAIERVAHWPGLARPARGLPPRLPVRMAPVPRFPYHIAYLHTPDGIRILAFAHDRREPSYWHVRIGEHAADG